MGEELLAAGSKYIILHTHNTQHTHTAHRHEKKQHNAGNDINKQKLALKVWSFHSRESNYGPPACQADVLTMHTRRKFESKLVHITFMEIDHEIIPSVILPFH